MKKKSRLLALLLTLAMVLTYMPALAFAEEPDDEGDPFDGVQFFDLEQEGDGPWHRLYSDGEITFRLTDEDAFNVEGVTHYEGFVGIPGPEGWDEVGDDCFSYDDQEKTITIFGEKIASKFPDGEAPDNLGANISGLDANGDLKMIAGFNDLEFREARDPDYEFEEDRDMLPGWGIYVDKFRNVYADNAQFPEYDEEYEITKAEVKSGSNLIREYQAEKDGWYFVIKDTDELGDTRGTITLKVTYNDIEGKSSSYTFDVNVTNTVYEVDFYAKDNKWVVLPGEEVTLIADGRKMIAEKEEGEWSQRETKEGLGYKWFVEGDQGVATIKQDPDDPSRAVLKVNELPAGEDDYWAEVDVKVELIDNNDKPSEVRHGSIRNINVETEFDRLELKEPFDPELEIGESAVIKPLFKHYKMGTDPLEIKDVEFSVIEYDKNALDITQTEGGFKITRKTDWSTGFTIRAEWNDGEEDRAEEQRYNFDSIEYEYGRIRLEEDDEYWVHFYKIDDKTETMTLDDMNIEFLDEEENAIAADKYNIEIGRSGWDEEKEEDFFEPVEGAFGIADTDKDVGFTQYTIRAVTKAGVKPRVRAEAEFFVVHNYALGFFADVHFAEETRDDWRMADRFWVDKAFMADPQVKSVDGKELKEGQDYTVTYYKRLLEPSDGPEVDRYDVLYNDKYREKLTSRPSECGGYLIEITGKGDYYGEYLALLDITSEGADSVQNLIDALNTTTPDEAAVAKARAEYNKLSADEKALVDISKLTKAETKLAADKAEKAKAAAEQAEWNGVLNKKIPAAKSVKTKAAKKKVTVSWTKANKKNLKKFDTVEIQVCTDKKFNKANTIRKTVKKSKKSLVVKKLTSKKTYYVRVRDVKGSGATKQVSKWSKVKKVKIK